MLTCAEGNSETALQLGLPACCIEVPAIFEINSDANIHSDTRHLQQLFKLPVREALVDICLGKHLKCVQSETII